MSKKPKMAPHSFRLRTKRVQWLTCCIRCGLIPLRNKETERETKKGCPVHEED